MPTHAEQTRENGSKYRDKYNPAAFARIMRQAPYTDAVFVWAWYIDVILRFQGVSAYLESSTAQLLTEMKRRLYYRKNGESV